jgi:hypothetical protein
MRSRLRVRSAIVGAGVVAGLWLPAVASAATVSLWHMDETSGTVMHDALGGNNGALTAVSLGWPNFSGSAGHSFGFDGSSSIVKVNSAPNLNPGSADFGVSLHLYSSTPPSAAVGDYDLARKGLSTTAGGEWKVEVLRGNGGAIGVASCHLKGSSGSGTVTAGSNVTDGRWHTISCYKRAGSMLLIVDNAWYSKTVTIGSISNTAKLTIGAKVSGADWTRGLIDEVSWSMP